MKSTYSVIIQWSDEDKAFIATLPEFDGALTHGSTYEEAARMAEELLESLIESYEADGKALPSPDKFIYEERVRTPVGV